jgi:hypothetical protein
MSVMGCNGEEGIFASPEAEALTNDIIANHGKSLDLAAAKHCAAKNNQCSPPPCAAKQITPPGQVGSDNCSIVYDPSDPNEPHYMIYIMIQGVYNCWCPNDMEIEISTSDNPNTLCGNDSILLTASINFSNVSYYQWVVNDTIIEGASDPYYYATTPGSYQVMVVDTDGIILLSAPVAVNCIIPTLSQWGLIIFGSLLLITGVVFVWRRYA